jgi:hypothetical protein
MSNHHTTDPTVWFLRAKSALRVQSALKGSAVLFLGSDNTRCKHDLRRR